jgi:hypothetical protein
MNGSQRTASHGIRIIGLLLLVMGSVGLVWPAWRAERLDRSERELLLQVQEALQRYHVAEELYPKRPMPGGELIDLLQEREFLPKDFGNPWSGSVYDKTSEDRLRYGTDPVAETYELIVLQKDGTTEKRRLDSTTHQSLEE